MYVYKGKNHFSEMKRDVGMSGHEREGEQEDAYTETGIIIDNPIPTSLLCYAAVLLFVDTGDTILG